MQKKQYAIYGSIALVALLIIAGGLLSFSHKTTEEWKAIRDIVLPQFVTVDTRDSVDIIRQPFTEDLDVGIVVATDTRYQFVSQEEMDIWKIDERTLFDQAIRNLNARSQDINVEVAVAGEKDPTAKYVIVELDDGFAAARLLSDGVRRAIARELGDEYVAAIPTRDFLIFWHKDFPLFDAFAKQVELEFEAEEDYPLTPVPLFVGRNGIEAMVKKQPDDADISAQ